MYQLIVIFYSTICAIGPTVDDHPSRNLAVQPTVSQSSITLGTYDDEAACNAVGLHFPTHKKTAYADIDAVPVCLWTPPPSPKTAAAQ